MEFEYIDDALGYMDSHGIVITAELTDKSIPLTDIHTQIKRLHKSEGDIFVIVGNEITGVDSQTLKRSDIIPCSVPKNLSM
jgi:hypothetical protein